MMIRFSYLSPSLVAAHKGVTVHTTDLPTCFCTCVCESEREKGGGVQTGQNARGMVVRDRAALGNKKEKKTL